MCKKNKTPENTMIIHSSIIQGDMEICFCPKASDKVLTVHILSKRSGKTKTSASTTDRTKFQTEVFNTIQKVLNAL